MKKFLCATCLLLFSMMAMATAQMKAYSTGTMNLRNDYTGNDAPDGDAYSFTSSRADFS